MNKIIETKRLVLREFYVSDAEDLFKLNSDPKVIKYTGDLPFLSIMDAKTFLKNYMDYKNNGFGRWAIISKNSNQFLGWCGLKLNEENLIDIGFRFFQNQWGKGYATESARASLNFGFNQLNIKEIIGRASLDNIASIKVLEKSGMKFWKNDHCNGIEKSAYYKINKAHYNTLND